MSWFSFNPHDFSISFLSILFEGVPYLFLGTLLSGLIDAFLPAQALERWLPKNAALAIGVAGILGFFLPMCECGVIPVIRRMLKKGLPIGPAVTYLLASPIINPVGPQQVLEHSTLTFTVSATDPDGDAVTLSAVGMPIGAIFNPTEGIFSWTPGYPSAGIYTPTFIATDNGTPTNATSSMDVVITVGSNPTPVEQSQTLINVTVAAGLPTSIENAYLANLNKVGPFIEQGKTNPAINQLNVFIQKANQDYSHGKITQQQLNDFVSKAHALITAIS